jgi:A/G-specific adenine glycosylase
MARPRLTDDQRALLAWGRKHLRDLPWRATRDPWHVLVAEVMLQQTQADRVVPRWTEFCERWPTPADVAAAHAADVLVAWQGMGYPRRVLNLQRAAAQVVELHGGVLPADLDALLALPGVGPYTARAVLAFAFEADAAVVDTNVGRVLARRAGERLTPSAAQRAADEWLPPGRSWAWNQTLLDLGATVCRPAPECAHCPVADGCAWRGGPAADPAAGSAGVSRRQAKFDGSLRQARGAVMAALANGPVRVAALEVPGGHDAAAVVASLESDGLVHMTGRGRSQTVQLGPAGHLGPG